MNCSWDIGKIDNPFATGGFTIPTVPQSSANLWASVTFHFGTGKDFGANRPADTIFANITEFTNNIGQATINQPETAKADDDDDASDKIAGSEVVVETTGEEDEEIIVNEAVRVSVFNKADKEWSSLGMGSFHLNKGKKEDGTEYHRFIIRRGVLQVTEVNSLVSAVNAPTLAAATTVRFKNVKMNDDDKPEMSAYVMRFANADAAKMAVESWNKVING